MDVEYRKFSQKSELYKYISEQLSLIATETADLYAALANTSALLKLELPDVNWVGFYLLKNGSLTLGPFQGKPAVANIPLGKGVCGTAAEQKKAQLVNDVKSCCNHIACDLNSASEIVVPIFSGSALLGVIDIDSPVLARFDKEDLNWLEVIADFLGNYALSKA